MIISVPITFEAKTPLTVVIQNVADASVLAALSQLQQQLGAIMATLADLQAAVAAEDTVIDSAITLLQGLAAQIAALTPNQAAIDALAADVSAKTQSLAAAVTANTPAAPAP